MKINYEDYDGRENKFGRRDSRKERRNVLKIWLDGEDINGIGRNPEGKEMANVVFMLDNHRVPSEEEVREYHKRLTKGHRVQIDEAYAARVANHRDLEGLNPFRAKDKILSRWNMEIKDIKDLQKVLEFGETDRITLHLVYPRGQPDRGVVRKVSLCGYAEFY